MTVLFLSRLFAPHIGGVEKHVDRISKLLVKEGYDVTIITEQFDPLLPIFEKNDITIYRIPIKNQGFWKKFVIWWWMLRHISLLKKSDIIHAHDVFFWYLPFCFLLPRKKAFVTFHGYESYPIRVGAKIMRRITEFFASGNISIGDFLPKWYGTKANYISYGGIDDKKYAKKQSDFSKSALFFGRLDEQTSIKEYLQVYEYIKKEVSDFQLKIVGNGPLETLIPTNVAHESFKTNLDQDIAKSEIIFVSRYLSILEALAAQKLVVAIYDNPIKKDYLEMSPMSEFILTGKNPKKLAEKILEVQKDKNFSKKIEKGAQWSRTQTWEKVLDTYKKLWRI